MKYRDMTPEQMLAWGHAERAARMADMEERTPEGLRAAQANAKTRRLAIGASAGQAAQMVVEANRDARRTEFDAARKG